MLEGCVSHPMVAAKPRLLLLNKNSERIFLPGDACRMGHGKQQPFGSRRQIIELMPRCPSPSPTTHTGRQTNSRNTCRKAPSKSAYTHMPCPTTHLAILACFWIPKSLVFLCSTACHIISEAEGSWRPWQIEILTLLPFVRLVEFRFRV